MPDILESPARPDMGDDKDITRLLQEVDAGRAGALDALMEAVYADLERVARGHMDRRFGPGQPGVTLEPAALVNESFLRLIKQQKRFDDRGHFFAIATKVMLRVLLDHDRKRRSAKRGGDLARVTLSLELPAGADPGPGIEVERLAAALERLEALDPRKAEVVKLRVLFGLTMKEVAASLDRSLAAVERDWAFAKAWLLNEADDSRIR